MKRLIVCLLLAGVAGCGGGPSQQTPQAQQGGQDSLKPAPPDVDLFKAAGDGNLEALKQHIAAGTDLDQRTSDDQESTPLMVASTFGRVEAAKALVGAGAKVDLKNSDGSTALNTAAFLCHTEIVQALLEKGADKKIRNNDGGTALDRVQAPWDDIKPIYELLNGILFQPAGIPLDYERIKATRPMIAQMLRQSGGNQEGSPAKKEAGGSKPEAKAPETLANFIKDKRIYVDMPIDPPAEKLFTQFNADGTFQVGAFVNGIALTFGKPDGKGKFSVSGLTLTMNDDAGGEDSVVFPTAEPIRGDKIAITGEEGEKTSMTIVKVEAAKPIQVASAAALLKAISGDSKESDDKKKSSMPKTAFEYAKMCEPELGVPPRINLSECVEIPLYVDGVQKYGVIRSKAADNPNLQGKEFTSSGSVLQRYEGRTAEGKPLPDVIWITFGRNEDWDGNHKDFTGSVQMIGYHKKTGATAFFETNWTNLNRWVTQDKTTLRMRGKIPWIDNPNEFNKAFVPSPMQCVSCHQADPFVINPFINAAKIPGTKENVVPILDEDSPYYVIGGEQWDMRTMHIEGHACFECHRVGMKTIELFINAGWDPNKHMPPHDPGSLAEDFRELLDAWQKGPEKVDGAEWIIPPARGKDRQVVGEDYPYKAGFNKWNGSHFIP